MSRLRVRGTRRAFCARWGGGAGQKPAPGQAPVATAGHRSDGAVRLTGMILWLLANMQRTVSGRRQRRSLGVAISVWIPFLVACAAVSCSKPQDNSPAVATAEVALSRPRVAQGSP